MNENTFKDYYKILQVHFDASPDVIRAAYKKLSKTYHPDSATADAGRMALLNEAFQILNDLKSRTEYHQHWMAHYFPHNDYVKNPVKPDTVSDDTSPESASEVMEAFFHMLQAHDWEGAYVLLSAEDKKKNLPEDFCDWREAVDLCSQMKSYRISYLRTFHDCRLDNVLYRIVTEFQVTVTELNVLTSETTTDTIRKCAVYDGASWRIWLGTASIKSATLRFRIMADKNKNIDPQALYHNAISKIDVLTGLLSESGFYEDAEREVARTNRYQNPFTLLAFQLHCNSREAETTCLIQLATLIKNGLRTTDFAARLNNNQIICLLTETKKTSGEMAAQRFIKMMSTQQSMQFHISFGVVFYSGYNDIRDAVLAACSIADEISL